MRESEERKALADLEARVKKARKTSDQKERAKWERKPDSSLSMAYRLSMEMVVAIAIGGTLGFFLDRWFETKPWLMLLFLLVGMAAGILNAYRASEKITEQMRRKQDEDNQG